MEKRTKSSRVGAALPLPKLPSSAKQCVTEVDAALSFRYVAERGSEGKSRLHCPGKMLPDSADRTATERRALEQFQRFKQAQGQPAGPATPKSVPTQRAPLEAMQAPKCPNRRLQSIPEPTAGACLTTADTADIHSWQMSNELQEEQKKDELSRPRSANPALVHRETSPFAAAAETADESAVPASVQRLQEWQSRRRLSHTKSIPSRPSSEPRTPEFVDCREMDNIEAEAAAHAKAPPPALHKRAANPSLVPCDLGTSLYELSDPSRTETESRSQGYDTCTTATAALRSSTAPSQGCSTSATGALAPTNPNSQSSDAASQIIKTPVEAVSVRSDVVPRPPLPALGLAQDRRPSERQSPPSPSTPTISRTPASASQPSATVPPPASNVHPSSASMTRSSLDGCLLQGPAVKATVQAVFHSAIQPAFGRRHSPLSATSLPGPLLAPTQLQASSSAAASPAGTSAPPKLAVRSHQSGSPRMALHVGPPGSNSPAHSSTPRFADTGVSGLQQQSMTTPSQPISSLGYGYGPRGPVNTHSSSSMGSPRPPAGHPTIVDGEDVLEIKMPHEEVSSSFSSATLPPDLPPPRLASLRHCGTSAYRSRSTASASQAPPHQDAHAGHHPGLRQQSLSTATIRPLHPVMGPQVGPYADATMAATVMKRSSASAGSFASERSPIMSSGSLSGAGYSGSFTAPVLPRASSRGYPAASPHALEDADEVLRTAISWNVAHLSTPSEVLATGSSESSRPDSLPTPRIAEAVLQPGGGWRPCKGTEYRQCVRGPAASDAAHSLQALAMDLGDDFSEDVGPAVAPQIINTSNSKGLHLPKWLRRKKDLVQEDARSTAVSTSASDRSSSPGIGPFAG